MQCRHACRACRGPGGTQLNFKRFVKSHPVQRSYGFQASELSADPLVFPLLMFDHNKTSKVISTGPLTKGMKIATLTIVTVWVSTDITYVKEQTH